MGSEVLLDIWSTVKKLKVVIKKLVWLISFLTLIISVILKKIIHFTLGAPQHCEGWRQRGSRYFEPPLSNPGITLRIPDRPHICIYVIISLQSPGIVALRKDGSLVDNFPGQKPTRSKYYFCSSTSVYCKYWSNTQFMKLIWPGRPGLLPLKILSGPEALSYLSVSRT